MQLMGITRTMPNSNRIRTGQRGFTMIELLIAVLVLSIGLLGLAALQAQALRNNQSSYHRTQATILAYDMIDRARANREGLDNGNYHLPANTQVNGCTSTPGCSAAQMSTNDMFEWNQLLGQHLPGGEGVVCRDGTPDDGNDAANHGCDNAANANHVIKLWWDDNGDGNIAQDERIIVEFSP